LEDATFEEKRDILNKLDIRVFPSEDLKTMRVKCGLKLTVKDDNNGSVGKDRCGIVMFGLPVQNNAYQSLLKSGELKSPLRLLRGILIRSNLFKVESSLRP